MDSINVVWTRLNFFTSSPQLDFCTNARVDGDRQDAMFRQEIAP